MQAVWFLQVLPRSLFKRLVLSTTLWQHAKMSTILKSPKGLKDLECKKGQLSSWPIIRYIPQKDLVTTKEVFWKASRSSVPMGLSSTSPTSPKGTPRNTLCTSLQPYVSSTKRDSMCSAGSWPRPLTRWPECQRSYRRLLQPSACFPRMRWSPASWRVGRCTDATRIPEGLRQDNC